MKYYAVNGSPRKTKNTAILLQSVLEGIQATHPDARTEIIHLYELDFQPCTSCFACKRLGGRSYGKCAAKDALAPILDILADADGVIFGSPIYFHSLSAKMRGFLERFLYQYMAYDRDLSSLAPKKMPTAFIYTMNATERQAQELNYPGMLHDIEAVIERVFQKPRILYAFDTYQFNDYTRYMADYFSEPEKALQKQTRFPQDIEAAFKIGAVMAAGRPVKA